MGEKILERILAWAEHMGPLLLEAAVILLVGKILATLTIKIMSKGLKKSYIDNTAHTFMMSIVKTLIYTFSVIIALSALNIPMSSIVAAVGAAGLTLGFALQSSLANVAGGFVIMFSKPFQIGDYVKIGESEGNISAISILYTRINTIDNKTVFIPNGTVSNTTITNYTRENLRRIELIFSISYHSDFTKACEVIKDVIKASPLSLDKPAEPLIVMGEHGESSIKILTRTWVKTEDYWTFRWYMFEHIKKSFDENGIEIPYNQLDVTIKGDK